MSVLGYIAAHLLIASPIFVLWAWDRYKAKEKT